MVGAVVAMGEPIFEAGRVPVDIPGLEKVVDYPISVDDHTFCISCVSMGNPHAVAFIEEPVDEFPLHVIGPQVETMSIFPERVNFEIVNVEGVSNVSARVWERGSGLTMACGTGACAVAAIGRAKGLTADSVTVSLPGGRSGHQMARPRRRSDGGAHRGGLRGRLALLTTSHVLLHEAGQSHPAPRAPSFTIPSATHLAVIPMKIRSAVKCVPYMHGPPVGLSTACLQQAGRASRRFERLSHACSMATICGALRPPQAQIATRARKHQ